MYHTAAEKEIYIYLLIYTRRKVFSPGFRAKKAPAAWYIYIHSVILIWVSRTASDTFGRYIHTYIYSCIICLHDLFFVYKDRGLIMLVYFYRVLFDVIAGI